jgi:glutamate racemase
MDSRPIGIFDSGVGGLSVWREIARQLPQESTVYFADQAHVPYGPRGAEQIRHFCDRITRFLIEQDCKAVVVACNTASAAALKYLRDTFPELPTIGMEPAVKPAAESTRTRVVGIMATPATFQGKLFQATVGRHAQGIQLINQVCAGLAEQVESGDLESDAMQDMLRGFIQPMLDAGADTIVLACSHYPFALDSIRRIAGPQVNVIDPAPAIARQVGRVLGERGLLTAEQQTSAHIFYTSSVVETYRESLSRLINWQGPIRTASWDADGRLNTKD